MRQKGFTLIELLVVITIIGILSAIGLTSYTVANQKARDSRRAADVGQLRSALEVYRSTTGAYPVSTACLSTAACWGTNVMTPLASYLSGQTVVDPKNDATYRYSYTGTAATYSIGYTREIGGAITPITNP